MKRVLSVSVLLIAWRAKDRSLAHKDFHASWCNGPRLRRSVVVSLAPVAEKRLVRGAMVATNEAHARSPRFSSLAPARDDPRRGERPPDPRRRLPDDAPPRGVGAHRRRDPRASARRPRGFAREGLRPARPREDH